MRGIFTGVADMQRAMSYHSERHGVLAGNVANVDTPGYRAKDLATASMLADPSALSLSRTDTDHIAGGNAGFAAETTEDGADAISGLDGNTVILERELAKIDANRVRYSATSEIVSRRLALLRYASGDGMG